MTRFKIEPARLISLAFWMTLVAATGLYGLVMLAPDWLTLGDLADHEAKNLAIETALEDRVEYLERIRDTLKTEPGYAKELARLDVEDVRPDENRMTVDESLRLARLDAVAARTSEAPGNWSTRPAVATLAHNDTLKTTLLVIAAVMVLLAFTALHESHAERLARLVKRLRTR